MITCTAPAEFWEFYPLKSTLRLLRPVSGNIEDHEVTRRGANLLFRRYAPVLWGSPYLGQTDAVSSPPSLTFHAWFPVGPSHLQTIVGSLAQMRSIFRSESCRQRHTFHPVFIIIPLPYRHLKSSCHHHGEQTGTLPIHRYQQPDKQDHEPFGM